MKKNIRIFSGTVAMTIIQYAHLQPRFCDMKPPSIGPTVELSVDANVYRGNTHTDRRD
jgi:hypothetical protein